MALSPDFYNDETKQKRWNASVTKNNLYVEAISIREVMTGIGEFILPIFQAEAPAILTWNPGGPWKNSRDQA